MFASVVFIFNELNEVLLVKRHPEDPWMPHHWAVVGGKVEPNETSKQAAIREVFEETNLVVDDLTLFEIDGKVSYFWTKKFFGNVHLSFEHSDWKWVSLNCLQDFLLVPGIWQRVELLLRDWIVMEE